MSRRRTRCGEKNKHVTMKIDSLIRGMFYGRTFSSYITYSNKIFFEESIFFLKSQTLFRPTIFFLFLFKNRSLHPFFCTYKVPWDSSLVCWRILLCGDKTLTLTLANGYLILLGENLDLHRSACTTIDLQKRIS